MRPNILQIIPMAVMIFLFFAVLMAVTAAPEAESAPPVRNNEVSIAAAVLGSKISYQGVLKEGGSAVTGSRNLVFRLYGDSGCANQVGADIAKFGVPVNNGLFEVQLEVDPADFEGEARWLGVDVGNTGSNIVCQEMLPAPYALSLRPGATINNTATGYALRGESAAGLGIYGYSDDNYGVQGSSASSWGGYFDSGQGYGVRVNSSGTDHYDHGAYITAQSGYAVYAQSAQNMAVRGEAGDVSGVSQPVGPVGVVGLGSNRGVFGASSNGSGLYGSSNDNYGVWGQSDSYRGVTGRTNRVDNNYGIYTSDNLYAREVQTMNGTYLIAQNNGGEAVQPGDVVVFNGIDPTFQGGDTPLVQVAAATAANSAAVAGVVSSRFNIEAIAEPANAAADLAAPAGLEVTPEGPVAPGEYLLLVVQGPAKVNVRAMAENIVPGTLLSTAGQAGFATAVAGEVQPNAVAASPTGTVFGKALEPLEAGQDGQIYVFVTLH